MYNLIAPANTRATTDHMTNDELVKFIEYSYPNLSGPLFTLLARASACNSFMSTTSSRSQFHGELATPQSVHCPACGTNLKVEHNEHS